VSLAKISVAVVAVDIVAIIFGVFFVAVCIGHGNGDRPFTAVVSYIVGIYTVRHRI